MYRYETNIGNGVTSIEFDRKDIDMNKMAVTTLEVYICMYLALNVYIYL